MGVVEARGLDATGCEVGDEAVGYLRKDRVRHGCYAEPVSAPVCAIAREPASLDWLQAAGLPLAGLTAYQAGQRLGIGGEDTVLTHAASGGVGSFGVRIAVARGARVTGTASAHHHAYPSSDDLAALCAEPWPPWVAARSPTPSSRPIPAAIAPPAREPSRGTGRRARPPSERPAPTTATRPARRTKCA
ncbi:hypothetical protein H8N00_09995 [Streptomyces sp. AC563]|uniref:hypothetical protein n=1 Tax=Streptomyces buecherae TaxID=2763006 RepID=UPI00164DC84E|nr:hypothetical protein [Streptomyces buecherae]MBC3989204.1 hypothetical protein [Streptomyces buecherae]